MLLLWLNMVAEKLFVKAVALLSLFGNTGATGFIKSQLSIATDLYCLNKIHLI